MRSTRASRRRSLLAATAVGTLVLAACGSDESESSTASGPSTDAPADAGSSSSPPVTATDSGGAAEEVTTEPTPAVSEGTAPATDAPTEETAAPTSARYDDGGLDLVGTEIGAASDVGGNPFPDLVVDDLNRGKQVNLRNAIPGERPVLLWFWAPH